jgi:hypothetical protein
VHGAAIFGEPKHGERREVPIAPHIIDDLNALADDKEPIVPLVDSARGEFICTIGAIVSGIEQSKQQGCPIARCRQKRFVTPQRVWPLPLAPM